MTKEGKAREIIEQGGACDGISCDFEEQNECPIFRMCELSGGNSCKSESKVSACREFIGSIQPSKTLLDEFAMAAMEGICANVPLEQFAQDVLDKKYDNDAQTEAYADVAMEYARAMMKERARRDEMGNVKEVKK